MAKKNTHSRLINDLAKRLEDSSHDYILNKEIMYGIHRTGNIGEIDLLATSDNNKYKIICEMKSRDTDRTRAKAMKQLSRAKRYMRGKIYTFYVTPTCLEWIR